MRRPATAELYVGATIERIAGVTPMIPGLDTGPVDAWQEAPWTRSLAASRWTGCWRTGHRHGRLTLDLVRASRTHTLVTVVLEPTRPGWTTRPTSADAGVVARVLRVAAERAHPVALLPVPTPTARVDAPGVVAMGYSRP